MIKNLDDEILHLQGHDASMPRSFSSVASIGLAFSITGSWVGYLSCFGASITFAGPQNVVLGLVVGTVVQWIITLGLAEIASAFPSSGGQYHAVFCMASEGTRRSVSYLTGWFSMLAWWINTSSGLMIAAKAVLGLASFCWPTYDTVNWHVYLVYLLVMLVTAAPLTMSRTVPWITQGCLYISVSGFLMAFIVVMAMHQEFQPQGYLLHASHGTSGWPHGFAWILGAANSMYAYVGTDGAIHIAEEMNHPGRRIPQIMNLTMLIGVLSALPLFMALIYAIQDPEKVASATLPSLELFYQATGSRAVSLFLQIWVTTVYISSMTSQWVTSGRMAWAFARDGGIPFSDYFAVVDERFQSPIRATVLSTAFASLYGLLYLASTNAFSSITTSAVLYFNISYAIPQAMALFRGRAVLPRRSLNLGPIVGPFCNAFTVIAVLALVIIYSCPSTLPTQVDSMNYSSVVLVGISGIILASWLLVGSRFRGPDVDLQRMHFLLSA
ncbi:amino acid transporter [Aspergillus steynii IBT 23096]|uniref:Amino acid transporter n=1 Tax=Aspergillus steynii IBT 23096 TaxID=1392250 RepID=A0A2I2GPB7_9EURO|nr:amino acid transporter [Aspergillus steynii IBT 23096]PLB54719.1 amino acid transporter [Aspergillus steynii IBT 23096]